MVHLPLANVQLWITPIWILSIGVTAAALILALLYGLAQVAWPAGARVARQAAADGILTPIAYVVGAFVLLCLLASPSMPVAETLDSIQRLGTVGYHSVSFVIDPNAEDQEVAVDVRSDELKRYEFAAESDLRISTESGRGFIDPDFTIEGGEAYNWDPGKKYQRIFQDEVTALYVTNPSDEPVNLTFGYETDVEMPVVHHLPIVIASVLGLVLVYFLMDLLLPGISTVAIGTAKEAISQPLFLVLTVVGGVLLVLFIVIPYNTFGEDVKMLISSGLSLIMVLSIFFAVWTASTSVSEEIEGKTALTMLSKPVSRRQFVLGKYVGILWPLLVMFVILGAVLLVTISIKVVYDARESSQPTPDWELCYNTMIMAVPGLVLSFLQAATLASIATAISTRLSMLPNLIIVGVVFAIGNLLPQIVRSSAGDIPFVKFAGQLLAVVVPVLDHFNIEPAIAGGQSVPYGYLGMATLYCLLYITAAMLLALLLFEDRDMA